MLEELFMMKSYAIHHRTRSRDLFDLKTFVQMGRTLDDIFAAGRKADPAYSEEYAKAVLIGEVPLDKEDEGFETIGLNENIHDIYQFFLNEVNCHEQRVAEEIAMSQTLALALKQESITKKET